VIHGEGFGGIRFTAIVASAPGQLTLPPLRASQFPGFLPLPADRGIVYVIHEIIQDLVSQPSVFGLHYGVVCRNMFRLEPLLGTVRGYLFLKSGH